MATDLSRASSGPTAGDAKAEAKTKASELKDKTQNETKDRLSEGKSKATGALEDVAGALHGAGDTLRDRDRDAFARYADTAADQVDQFARSVRDRSVGELLDEAQRFARRDPGLFVGGAFVLGIFGARFLKASAPTHRSDHGRAEYSREFSGGSRRGEYATEPPAQVRHTAGGEMPNPDAERTQVPASATRSSAV